MSKCSVKNRIRYLILSLSVLFLTGCGTSDQDIYDSVNSLAKDELTLGNGNIFTPEAWLRFTDRVKWWVPYVILISWIICIVLSVIFKRVKSVRKKVFMLFGVGIPGVAFVAVNFVSYMYGHLWR